MGGEEQTVAEELRVFAETCMVDGGEEFSEEAGLGGGHHGCGGWGLYWEGGGEVSVSFICTP